jgi:hypothetical protein
MPLRTDPETHAAWQAKSRQRAAERAREKPRSPLTSKGPVKKRRPDRKAIAFVRGFGSVAFVDATRREPCIFCGQQSDTVRTAHLLQARGFGGCGGDVTGTGPACHPCDDAWGQGSGPSPTRERFLETRGMTWDELVRRIAEHHAKHGHLYREKDDE